MSRTYTELKCGCLISCDGGGGLVPCDSNSLGTGTCYADKWTKQHKFCPHCGECMLCADHKECKGVKNGRRKKVS